MLWYINPGANVFFSYRRKLLPEYLRKVWGNGQPYARILNRKERLLNI
jgi:hypothetical protein